MLMLAMAGASAAGGWVWLDERGQKVYSDMPPPSSVPSARILQQPMPPKPPRAVLVEADASGAKAPTTPAATSIPTSKPPASTPPQGAANGPGAAKGADAQRKIDAENKAIERRNAEIRADNCKRANESLSVIAGGGRVATVNESGQRVIMDPAMRSAEKARLERIIADNCK